MTPSQHENTGSPGKSPPAEKKRTGSELPRIDFATFIVSLNSAALVHLGVLEEPSTKNLVKNLPLAKQTIDILTMLEEKTRGNLTPEERTMLQSMLYDLRVIYVKEG